ncbi:unnamed protein product [Diamesa hyperborea]
MNFSAFGTFPSSIHQFTSVASGSQENRYNVNTNVNFNQTPVSTSVPVKFRAEDIVGNNVSTKYAGHSYAPTTSHTNLQYGSITYNSTTNQPSDNTKNNNYVQTTSSSSTITSHAPSELSQDITNLLLKEQSNSDAKRVLQSSSVADYLSLSHLPTPLSLHHFLKYSADSIKKETTIPTPIQQQSSNQIINTTVSGTSSKKKKKKKPPKEKKPRPKVGEIRIKFALDGSILFCCPECGVCYPEKEILDSHMIGHQNLERRFVCDICSAALKRKDHLTRHKQSHNPERPYLCHCLKAFKRKEQLSLHSVIHSGHKRHACIECGKGFYRKDHLRKHARSHIARKVKAELSQQMAPANSNNTTNQQEQSDALQHVHIIQQQSHNNSPQMHHQTC